MSPESPDRESIDRRIAAVERALSEEQPLERADRIEDIETRLQELEAAVQAIRGYVGEVRAVNEDVERKADRAYRKAEVLERHLASREPDAAGDDGAHDDQRGDGALARLGAWRGGDSP